MPYYELRKKIECARLAPLDGRSGKRRRERQNAGSCHVMEKPFVYGGRGERGLRRENAFVPGRVSCGNNAPAKSTECRGKIIFHDLFPLEDGK